MAQGTTLHLPCFEENPEADENLPPEAIVLDEMSMPTVKVNMDSYASTKTDEENQCQPEICVYSTPSQGSGKKSRMSGFQSALTPILKYLNIGNRRQLSEPQKCEKNSPECLPTTSFGGTPTHCQQSVGMSKQQPLSAKTSNACWLDEECLPEITLLDDAYDSTMLISRNDSALPESMLATPVKVQSSVDSVNHPNGDVFKVKGDANNAFTDAAKNIHSSSLTTQLVSSDKANLHLNTLENSSFPTPATVLEITTNSGLQDQTFESKDNGKLNLSQNENGQIPLNKNNIASPDMPIPLECTYSNSSDIHRSKLCMQNETSSTFFGNTVNLETSKRVIDCCLPDITLLDVTRDSDPIPGTDLFIVKVAQKIPPVDVVRESRCFSDLDGLSVPLQVDIGQVEERSFAPICSVFTVPNEMERSKSLEDNMTSLDATKDMSVCDNLENDTSQKLTVENTEKGPTSVESTSSIQPANITYDMGLSSDVQPQQTNISDIHCCNSSIVVNLECCVEPMNMSNSWEANPKEPTNNHESETMEFETQSSPKMGESMKNTFTVTPSSNLNNPPDFNTSNEVNCLQNNTMDLSESSVAIPKAVIEGANLTADLKTAETSITHNCMDVKAHEVQSTTFESNSIPKSTGSSGLGEAVAGTFCLESTFDLNKPQRNTITLSESSLSVVCTPTEDKPSLSDTQSLSSDREKNILKEHPSEELKQNGTLPIPDSQTRTIDTTVSVPQTNPALEVTSVAGNQLTNGTSDLANVDKERNNSVFNLDDTLDMKSEPLVTSTPMPHFKVFPCPLLQCPDVETFEGQKNLRKEPTAQVPLNPPSNLISNQKTLVQPLTAARLILPKLKYKMASTQPRTCEPFINLPMTRLRAKAEALKVPTANEPAQLTTEISSSQSVPTTTGSKLNTFLPRPSGIQRAATGIRPPSTRSNVPSSGTDRLNGPTVHNPVVKPSHLVKHPLTRNETLPAKRKKLDENVHPGDSSASTANSDAPKASMLRQPATETAVSVKASRDDSAVPASTTGASAQCYVGGRGKSLKQIKQSHRAQLTKPQSQRCTRCAELEEQLRFKSAEITRLKKELLKYTKKDC